MFTGIIICCGKITKIEKFGADCSLEISASEFDFSRSRLGDSIAVNGVCLTVVSQQENSFRADVSAETLRRTNLGNLQLGQEVNLESALRLGDSLDGHLVSGHVDGLGYLQEKISEARSEKLWFKTPPELMPYIAVKGSITIDGISLTVNELRESAFAVNIIPHTAEKTTLKNLQIGQAVNLEVDLIARYLERLMLKNDVNSPLNLEKLQQNGFL